jgi:AraC family transcriptional regulator
VVISPAYVDQILDSENFAFITTWNVEDEFLKGVAHTLQNEIWKGEEADNIYIDGLIISFIIHLASRYPASNKKIFAPKGKLSASQLLAVIEFAKNSIHKNIRLSEMAAEVHLSEYHFARLFRQTVGISPYKYVLQMKIAQAKNLIRQQKKSCSDVAYILNFSDQAHFSHVFKRFTGYSPRNFINAIA